MNEKMALELVSRLIQENKHSNEFTSPIPENWPIEAWRLLMQTDSELWSTESLHMWIAGHTYAPEEVVRILSASPSERVRWRVASKRNLPKDLFSVLASDECDGVRQSIVRNRKAPLEVLENLRNDPSLVVRKLVEMRLS